MSDLEFLEYIENILIPEVEASLAFCVANEWGDATALLRKLIRNLEKVRE